MFLTIIFYALTTLLVIYLSYLAKSWAFRRDGLFGLLAGAAIIHSYEQFRPGAKLAQKMVGDTT